MEKVKKIRTVSRGTFTRAFNNFEEEKMKTDLDMTKLKTIFLTLENINTKLLELDSTVLDELIDLQTSDTDLDKEALGASEYQFKFAGAKVFMDEILNLKDLRPSGNPENRKKVRLPVIEWKKFGGDLKGWLPFWAQFRKIHEDKDIEVEDKFQYLIQATEPGSRARELVESFPVSKENYTLVIDSLKSRFGRDDLLVEVYVRELLKLVLSNALNPTSRPSLSSLYDSIESHLRALGTIGVTADKYAAMLFPLVESSLPEELLRAWQRSSYGNCGDEIKNKTKLDQLMSFLKGEVEGEERISLAVAGFGLKVEEDKHRLGSNQSKFGDYGSSSSIIGTPSAASLHMKSIVNTKKEGCIFCCKTNHASENCFRAQKMSVDEKEALVRRKGHCFKCLGAKHMAKQCRASLRCLICGRAHIMIMCRDLNQGGSSKQINRDKEQSEKSSGEGTQVQGTPRPKGTLSQSSFVSTQDITLQTLEVILIGTKGSKRVRALIDSGSQLSYILSATAKQLGCDKITEEKIVHSLFGAEKTGELHHNVYCVEISGVVRDFKCNLMLLDMNQICDRLPPIKIDRNLAKELENLKIDIVSSKNLDKIEILFGADVLGDLLLNGIHKLSCGLLAMDTQLGWTLMGKNKIEKGRSDTVPSLHTAIHRGHTDISISDLWNLDLIGIENPEDAKSKNEIHETTKQHFEKTVAFLGDRYQIDLPWIEGHPPLPTNFIICKKRLENTTRKLEQDNLYLDYEQVLREWLQEGIIEEVPPEEYDKERAHYLPHRAVVKESSLTTRVRPVFDASAKTRGAPSLNQCLDKGPNMLALIPEILLGFREKAIGVQADIRKAFLQVSINMKDRDYLRFLWWVDQEKRILKMYRHCRVVFGVSCSPFLLAAVIEYHLKLFLGENRKFRGDIRIIKILLKSYYVDNLLTSVKDSSELKYFTDESIRIMDLGGFDLRSWQYTAIECEEAQDDSEITVSVLGLEWNRATDKLQVKPVIIDQEARVTKRAILSVMNKVFDPLGFVCPAMLVIKILLREAWLENKAWDAVVSSRISVKFLKWIAQVDWLNKIKVPRCLRIGVEYLDRVTMHVFCDASKQAYAVVVFFRIESKNIEISFVQAKSRLAKDMSIPRLELMAAVIGARLAATILKTLNHKSIRTVYWSDSTTVLAWIKREDMWNTFVKNRIDEIKTLTNPRDWRYVPGNLQPADLPSRGCSPKTLFELGWWQGPSWLQKPEHKWPCAQGTIDEGLIKGEQKKSVVSSTNFNNNECEWCSRDKENTDSLCCKYNGKKWYFRHFSKFCQIVRLVAYIVRFTKNCRLTKDRRQTGTELTVDEIENSKKIVFKSIQQEAFKGENDPQIISLNPFTDEDGIIRIKTKILQREDKENFLLPVVLPAKHFVVRSLIRERHNEESHAGTQILLNILREDFWILSGRRTVRSVVKRCVRCQRHNAKHVETPPAALPEERVTDAKIFEIIGIDLAGPLICKDGKKVWIGLFTCAIYRAVHLEVMSSLSTEVFLLALRRFVARRGRPKLIYCDNGTNFVGANNQLKELNWDKISTYSPAMPFKFRFLPPSAPWWGGWWERLVGLTKNLLKKVLGKSSLTYEELQTVLCDCESVINRRPLTYLPGDENQIVPLTPAMFLHEIKETSLPDCDELEREGLNRRYNARLQLMKELRKRFRVEYLGQLVHHKKTIQARELEVGEVVLISFDNLKKVDWPLATIEELMPGSDGVERVARLRTATGELVRPVQKLFPLEVRQADVSAWRQVRTMD